VINHKGKHNLNTQSLGENKAGYHGRPQKFFQGGQRQNFAYQFQVSDDTMQMDVHKAKRFTLSTSRRKYTCDGNKHKNALRWQQLPGILR